MCGIAGFYQSQFDYRTKPEWSLRLNRMKDSLLRRGPDGNGLHMEAHCGLAHARLAIIDLLRGRQPMGKLGCHITYNGELYNVEELKERIQRDDRGSFLSWETDCDTEVVLNGYLTFGYSFFRELNGIFAFGIYDSRTDALVIARDHLGVKPLFYQETAEGFVFASEPKALNPG